MNKEYLTTDEVKTIELDILDTIHEFCEKHDIHYFIEAGTLLGAVRHKGFIPWDDDIDIGMLRKDYNKFIELFPKDGIKGYKLLSPGLAEDCHITFSKVYDQSTLKQDEEFESTYWRYGIDVDIFPWDAVPDNLIKREIFNKEMYFLFHAFLAIVGKKRKESSALKTQLRNSIFACAKFLSRINIISAHKVCIKLNSVAQKYNKKGCACACDIVLPDCGGTAKATNIKGLRDRVLMKFENKLYWAPAGYDECLRNAYGNYMQLPPKEKQITHHLSQFYRNYNETN